MTNEIKELIKKCGLTKTELLSLVGFIELGNVSQEDETYLDENLDGTVSAARFKFLRNEAECSEEDEQTIPEVSFFDAEISESGLYVGYTGYTDYSSDTEGKVILLDSYYNKLSVLLWSDINDENYTHNIEMSGAKNSERIK